jgi:hypothetical protein
MPGVGETGMGVYCLVVLYLGMYDWRLLCARVSGNCMMPTAGHDDACIVHRSNQVGDIRYRAEFNPGQCVYSCPFHAQLTRLYFGLCFIAR